VQRSLDLVQQAGDVVELDAGTHGSDRAHPVRRARARQGGAATPESWTMAPPRQTLMLTASPGRRR